MSQTTPVQIYKQPNAPDQGPQTTPYNPIPWIDDLWIDIVNHQIKQCTSTNPYVWVQISGGGPSLNDPFVTWENAGDLTNQKVVGSFLTSVLQSSLPFARGGTILTPGAPVNVIVWEAPFACTVTNVRGYASVSTGSTINAQKNGSLEHLASDLTLSSLNTWLDGGAVQNTAYSAGDKMEIMITGISGTPGEIGIQVNLTRP